MEPSVDTPKLTSGQFRGEQASLHCVEKYISQDLGVTCGRKPNPKWLKHGGLCNPEPGRFVLASFTVIGTRILSLGPSYFLALLSVYSWWRRGSQCSCRRLKL